MQSFKYVIYGYVNTIITLNSTFFTTYLICNIILSGDGGTDCGIPAGPTREQFVYERYTGGGPDSGPVRSGDDGASTEQGDDNGASDNTGGDGGNGTDEDNGEGSGYAG
jgi:hypothetical protein